MKTKKLLSLLLAVAMVAAIPVGAFAAGTVTVTQSIPATLFGYADGKVSFTVKNDTGDVLNSTLKISFGESNKDQKLTLTEFKNEGTNENIVGVLPQGEVPNFTGYNVPVNLEIGASVTIEAKVVAKKDGDFTFKSTIETAATEENKVTVSGAKDYDDVVTAIGKIPVTIVYTSECNTLIENAEKYKNLDQSQKAKISAEDIGKVDTARAAYNSLKGEVDAVISEIGKIGAVSYTGDTKKKIDDARAAYDALDVEGQQGAVSNYTTLTKAETAFEAAKGTAISELNEMITHLPAKAEVKLTDKDAINTANEAYKKILDADKTAITDSTKLNEAVEALNALIAEEEQNKAKASEVDNKIIALGDAAGITLENKTAVKEARAAYDGLTDAQKGYVTKLEALKAAEKAIADLEEKIKTVEAKITAIGEVAFNDASKAKIQDARDAYKELGESLQKKVTNYAKLTEAEKAYAEAKAKAGKSDIKNDPVATDAPAVTTPTASVDAATKAKIDAIETNLKDTAKTKVTGLETAIPDPSISVIHAKFAEKGKAVPVDETVTLTKTVKLTINFTSADFTPGSEKVVYDITPSYTVKATVGTETVDVVNKTDIKTTPGSVTMTLPVPDAMKGKDLRIEHEGNIYFAKATDEGFVTFTNPDGFSTFTITVTDPADAGYNQRVAVLNDLYMINDNKELKKVSSANKPEFGDSVYVVIAKNAASGDDASLFTNPAKFITDKDDTKDLKISKFEVEENAKLIDGKPGWVVRMINIGGKKQGVWLYEIKLKENTSSTSDKDVFGHFELKTDKPFYTAATTTTVTRGGVYNFAMTVDAKVITGSDAEEIVPDKNNVYEFPEEDEVEITLYNGEAMFVVDTRGQGKLRIETNVEYNEGIEKADPDANYVYYNSNYPTFNRLGYLYIYADEDSYLYKVDEKTGRLSEMTYVYDNDEDAFRIRTRTLGSYVVAEEKLDLDKINAVIDPPSVVSPEVKPNKPSSHNPPTGAAI